MYRSSIILGGGHGTQALSLVPDQKIYFGTWDDGGSTGFLRSIFPDSLPFGDLRAVLSARLKQQEKVYIADLLNSRSANINQLSHNYTLLIQEVGDECFTGFPEFLEDYYESKLRHLLKHEVSVVPEDNLGNLLLLFLYQTQGIEAVRGCVERIVGSELEFDYVYNEPVYLYGYYYDPQARRLKILDSETLIDTWHHPVIRFSVRDQTAGHPALSPQFLLDVMHCKQMFLAPGSPENYLPAMTKDLTKLVNKNNIRVVLIAQLFISSKDQYLVTQIRELAACVKHFEVWLPTFDSVRRVLADTNLLLSYAIQNKFLDIFFIPEYKVLLWEYLTEWETLSAENELYRLLYEVYLKRYTKSDEVGDWVMRACLEVVQESDGWKHDKGSIEHAARQM